MHLVYKCRRGIDHRRSLLRVTAQSIPDGGVGGRKIIGLTPEGWKRSILLVFAGFWVVSGWFGFRIPIGIPRFCAATPSPSIDILFQMVDFLRLCFFVSFIYSGVYFSFTHSANFTTTNFPKQPSKPPAQFSISRGSVA